MCLTKKTNKSYFSRNSIHNLFRYVKIGTRFIVITEQFFSKKISFRLNTNIFWMAGKHTKTNFVNVYPNPKTRNQSQK